MMTSKSSTDGSLFWKPSHRRKEDRHVAQSSSGSYHPRTTSSSGRPLLDTHRRQILYSVENYSVVVLVVDADAGGVDRSSGIATPVVALLSAYLVDGGWTANDFAILCCTHPQPRTTTMEILHEQQQQLLSETTHVNDGTNQRSPHQSRDVDFVTEETLLNEIVPSDPFLSRYSVVVLNIDVDHERTWTMDTILGIVLQLRRRKQRLDLRFVLACSTSWTATTMFHFLLQSSKSSDDVKSANDTIYTTPTDIPLHQRGTVITVNSKRNAHPVEIYYLSQPAPDYVVATVETIWKIHYSTMNASEDGDVLCFLPTGWDIDRAIHLAEEYFDQQHKQFTTIQKSSSSSTVDFIQLYESLPYKQQARTIHEFQRDSSSLPLDSTKGGKLHERPRRVVFATRIAEISVSVPNIRYVVDSGLVSLPYFDPLTGLERQMTGPTSQLSAEQRAAQVLRYHKHTSHHTLCYRLYTEVYWKEEMAPNTLPAIHRANVTGLLLTLKGIGVENLLAFELVDMPTIASMRYGLESLYALGAIDDKTRLTKMGLDMATFPLVEPRISRMLLESITVGCSWEVLAVASVLHMRRDLLYNPRGSGSKSSSARQQQLLDYEEAMADIIDLSGDHVTFVNVFTAADDNGWNSSDCKEKFVYYHALQHGMKLRKQLAKILSKSGKVQPFRYTLGAAADFSTSRSQAIRRCVTAGFFANVAKLQNDGRYYTLRSGILVAPSPNSVLSTHTLVSSEYIVFGESTDSSVAGKSGIEVQFVSAVEAKWLRDVAPHYWQ